MDSSNKYVKELFELLEIPTISAQTEHKADIKRACKWLKRRLERMGFNSRILPTDGLPVVYAQNLRAGKNRPTVLIYGHYDVQSPDPLGEWNSDPFKPEIRNGNIYARGVADDKGQLYTWIAAVDTLKQKGKLPINLKFLIEGEEEVGSSNLDEFVLKNKARLAADICVISDSHCLSVSQPLITYGLRGLAYFEVIVRTMPKDVHSGLYGGNVLNPVNVLSQIVAQLKDKNHRILIPGFYERVRKLSKKEVADLAKFPFAGSEIKQETGVKVLAGEENFIPQVRAGARPTLDVNGIWGGYQEEGPKTIIPAEAGVKISMRLVPNQTVKEIARKFEKYVRLITPKGVDVEIRLISTGEPILMEKKSKYFAGAEAAYLKTFGNKPLYELSGASIPVTYTLKSVLGMDSVLMGYGLPDDGLHSPNEKFSLAMFEKGIKTNVEFLSSF